MAADASVLNDVDLGFYRFAESRCPYYQAHLASAQGVLSLIPFGDHDDRLLSLPLFHVSGQGIMWRWLYAGARMTVRDKQPLEQMLGRLYSRFNWCQHNWRLLVNRSSVSLKAVLLAAAIPVELTEQAREQGIRCFCGYGLTEFASTVCAKKPTAWRRWFAAAGSGSENR
ncbi:AMP-binding protein [Escherichia coli]